MNAKIYFLCFLSLVTCCALGFHNRALAQQKASKPEQENRFEKAIQAFEKSDKSNPPAQGTVLFLGSSSIRMWDLKKWFPDKKYLNRGFGGSEISDSIHFFDRVVVPYKPKVIVFYAGDNDVAKGKTAEKVFSDFKTFASRVKKDLPQTRIVFVAIKPSLARWKLVEPMRKANQLIKGYADGDKQIVFADIDTPMIGKDKKPMIKLFKEDGLHLNEQGYKIWFDVIQPLLKLN